MATMLASAPAARMDAIAGRQCSSAARSSGRPLALLDTNRMCSPRFGGFRPQRRYTPRAQFCRPQGTWGPSAEWNFKGAFGTPTPEDIERLQRDIEAMFGGSWTGQSDWSPARSSSDRNTRSLYFPVDVLEGDDTYTFVADLPGMSRADTKVQANRDDRVLIISGDRVAPELTDEQRRMRRRTERRFGKFKRTFPLPEDADLDGIMAWNDNGVLTVVVKRIKPAEPTVTDVPINDWIDVEAPDALSEEQNPQQEAKWDDDEPSSGEPY